MEHLGSTAHPGYRSRTDPVPYRIVSKPLTVKTCNSNTLEYPRNLREKFWPEFDTLAIIKPPALHITFWSVYRVAFSEDSQRLFALNTQGRLFVWQRKDKIYAGRPPTVVTFPVSDTAPKVSLDKQQITGWDNWHVPVEGRAMNNIHIWFFNLLYADHPVTTLQRNEVFWIHMYYKLKDTEYHVGTSQHEQPIKTTRYLARHHICIFVKIDFLLLKICFVTADGVLKYLKFLCDNFSAFLSVLIAFCLLYCLLLLLLM